MKGRIRSRPAAATAAAGAPGSGCTPIAFNRYRDGRAERQIKKPAEIGVSGGPFPYGGNFTVWGSSPGN